MRSGSRIVVAGVLAATVAAVAACGETRTGPAPTTATSTGTEATTVAPSSAPRTTAKPGINGKHKAAANPKPTYTTAIKIPPPIALNDTPLVYTQPLTGVRLPLAYARLYRHPAVAIKISDVRESQPEVNIDKADIVFCEPNGPSYTRLAAVFHSKLPANVGPVRSIRPADAWLLTPLRPVFGNSDASRDVVEYVRKYGRLDDVGTARPGARGRAYSIAGNRRAPNHVMAHPRGLIALGRFKAPPKPYFSYGRTEKQASALVGGRAVMAKVPYGRGYNITYHYNAKTKRYYRWQPWGKHILQGGRQVSTKNVVIMQVFYRMVQIKRDYPVPVMLLNNKVGRLIVLTNGRMMTGTWSKKGASSPPVLRDHRGRVIKLAPGNTWVELPMPKSGVTVR